MNVKMTVLETTYDYGNIPKRVCDFCNEEPDNDVLVEKPYSMIIKGRLITSVRPKALYICLDCMKDEAENTL